LTGTRLPAGALRVRVSDSAAVHGGSESRRSGYSGDLEYADQNGEIITMSHSTARRRGCVFALTIAAIAATPLSAAAAGGHGPATELVSVSSDGEPGRYGAGSAAMSGDGRYVVFESDSPNLVPDGTAGSHIFLRDRSTGLTSRVSVGIQAQPGDAGSYLPSVSRDGRYVAFRSDAANLVPGDDNAASDAFVRDLTSGTTVRIPLVAPARGVNDLVISADGSHLAYATGLAPDGATYGVHVRHLGTGSTRLVSVGPAGQLADDTASDVSISADGSVVAFTSSAANLVPDDTNGTQDVFTHDTRTGHTQRVSVGNRGAQLWDSSRSPALSADGRVVAFTSRDTGIVPDDTNDSEDVFVHDLRSRRTVLASIDAAGRRGLGYSWEPSLSADGRFVAFSMATTPETQDTGRRIEALVRDLRRGVTSQVAPAWRGGPANGDTVISAMTPNARHVVFGSNATDLVPGEASTVGGLYVRGPLRRS
jgi:Tol biopolymer transport system component